MQTPLAPVRGRPPFILASASPQRKKLLETIGISPIVRPCNTDETVQTALSPSVLVKTLAVRKYAAFFTSAFPSPDDAWVLTADTLVFSGRTALGKPASSDDARRFLTLLSGRTHRVVTGFCLVPPRIRSAGLHPVGSGLPRGYTVSVSTSVRFKYLHEHDITWYLETGEWVDAAGAYRIQGAGAALVSSVRGSHTNVIGLPLAEIYAILMKHLFWQMPE